MSTSVGDPIKDNDAANEKYVNSKVTQDGVVSETSNIVSLTINTTNGEVLFPPTTKQYIDNFVCDVLQMIQGFTNNTRHRSLGGL